MAKRTLKVRNALTGKVREVVLPGSSAAKKKNVVKDARVDLKADVKGFQDSVKKATGDDSGEGDGAGNG